MHLPDDVAALYAEARRAVGDGAPNSAVLACRKILMHVAVDKNAEEGKTFAYYVEYLRDHGLVPPGASGWVDEIRQHGNFANHEIELLEVADAETVVDFTGMLLRVVFEYPERGRRSRDRRSGA